LKVRRWIADTVANITMIAKEGLFLLMVFDSEGVQSMTSIERVLKDLKTGGFSEFLILW